MCHVLVLQGVPHQARFSNQFYKEGRVLVCACVVCVMCLCVVCIVSMWCVYCVYVVCVCMNVCAPSGFPKFLVNDSARADTHLIHSGIMLDSKNYRFKNTKINLSQLPVEKGMSNTTQKLVNGRGSGFLCL